MTLHLTPEMLEGAYEYLKTTPPFRRWKLPPGEEVEFHVKKRCGADDAIALYWYTTAHAIAVSGGRVGHTMNLIGAMAHEMVHLHLNLIGKGPGHGKDFRRHAEQVCRYHGFDPRAF